LRRAIPVAIVRDMVPSRTAWAFLTLAVGLVAVVFIGTPTAGCLGPLGVTPIQCSKATGILPTVGLGLPVLAGAVLVAALVGVPGLLTPLRQRFIAAAIGAAVATAAYLALRPTTWTGPTSTGELISLALPPDVGAVATATMLGGAAGLVGAWLAARFAYRTRRVERSPR